MEREIASATLCALNIGCRKREGQERTEDTIDTPFLPLPFFNKLFLSVVTRRRLSIHGECAPTDDRHLSTLAEGERVLSFIKVFFIGGI